MAIDDREQRRRWDQQHGDVYTGHHVDEDTPGETSPPGVFGAGWRPGMPTPQRTIDDDELDVLDATDDDTD